MEVIPAAASANVMVFGWAYVGKVISPTLGFSMMLLALFASTYDGIVISPPQRAGKFVQRPVQNPEAQEHA